jgi:DNA-binding ferritin-like protein
MPRDLLGQLMPIMAVAKEIEVEESAQEESNEGAELLTTLVTAQQQYKIYHWQTKSFSQHKSFGKIYDSLGENIDELIEAYQGRYGRIIPSNGFQYNIKNYSSVEEAISYTDGFIEFLSERFVELVDDDATDLLNIRDEILGNLNQLKYLLTLV